MTAALELPQQLINDLNAFRVAFFQARSILAGRKWVSYPAYSNIDNLVTFGRRGYDKRGMTEDEIRAINAAETGFAEIVSRNPGLSRVVCIESANSFTYTHQTAKP